MSDVVEYHSGIVGAPAATLTTSGGVTAVLDACLVDGFNTVGVSGVTRVGGVVTVTTAANHNFSVGERVELSGANEAEYNGRWKVDTKPAANQWTFLITTVPTSPATGVISARHPPAGWSKTTVAVGVVVYRSGAGSLGHYMQVEDDNPYADANVTMRTRMAAGWTMLDSGSSLGEQRKVQKLAGSWNLIADDRTCYLIMGAANTFMFGEVVPYNASDAFHFFQSKGETEDVNQTARSGRHFPTAFYDGTVVNLSYMAPGLAWLRGNSQVGSFCNGHTLPNVSANEASAPKHLWQRLTTPNQADGSIPLLPMFGVEYSASTVLRGRFRGILHPLCAHASEAFVNNRLRLDDVLIGGLTKSIVIVRAGYQSVVQLAFDLGPTWG